MSRNNKGFTLVEVMISFVILLFVSLAMMQTALVSINSNMTNVIRDEAVSIAESRMSDLRSASFVAANWSGTTSVIALTPTAVTENTAGPTNPYRRSFKLMSIDFIIERTITEITEDSRNVLIVVSWEWKGQKNTHSVSTILRNTNATT